ncbi:UDP-N-acetylmuramoylalanine--D-glutamate ligase [Reichenbachiella faecimaris]|uniref:UDP-N-acetylmuramoylalanine--D-glutamate ligase n=1 Tax=Reichenbachiella faecimaris TaxID=692418 RepID=A0A1W2G8X5_REIFA|nr:UDP-N-acetylmuramoyl-L-alanine--D-glutamate ligase [Reichenbachiella faecimaris]SMD32746.1 UDP-N-acetylmuramoylalanine--D-glutamate ligase [Reichenbachiella faecimaris]
MKANKNHSVAILGSGESGMGALRLAAKHGLKIFLSDSKTIPVHKQRLIESMGASFEEGTHTLDRLINYDEIIKSPGIPETAAVIVELKKAGKSIISEIEFASRYTDAKIIGITGSNGKTSTTLLTTHILKEAGLKVASAGNVGNSFSDLLVDQSPDVIVLELSSFQLDGVIDFRPDIAMILNITPDHLDRYNNDIELYADAKWRLIKNMNKGTHFIFNQDDEMITKRVKSSELSCDKLQITTRSKTSNGAYFLEGYLIFDCEKLIQIVPIEDLPLLGRHNQYNQMAAILAAIQLEVPFGDIMKGLSTFKNAPHRMELIGYIQDIPYINDSKATNVDAVYYALDAMTRPVVWIAGGVNKGNDYAQIKTLVKNKVNTLICLGTDNAHLTEEFRNDVNILMEVKSAEEAVTRANELAQPGEVVLLSPACASFDLFNNYEHRGDSFREEVLKLKKDKEVVKA